jgi:hypothetical protein
VTTSCDKFGWEGGCRRERGQNSDRMGVLVLLQDLFSRYGSFELR